MTKNKLTGHAAIGENDQYFNICTTQEKNIRIKLTGQSCKKLIIHIKNGIIQQIYRQDSYRKRNNMPPISKLTGHAQ